VAHIHIAMIGGAGIDAVRTEEMLYVQYLVDAFGVHSPEEDRFRSPPPSRGRTLTQLYGAGSHIRCLICLESGHPSQACHRASGKRLGFRSLSPEHLQACQEGRCMEPNKDGKYLSAAEHVGGGNVKVPSRYFSCCRHDVDPSLRWMTLTVDERSLCTRAIEPQEFPKKGVAVLDLDAAIIKYDVSTYVLTVAHQVEPKWRPV